MVKTLFPALVVATATFCGAQSPSGPPAEDRSERIPVEEIDGLVREFFDSASFPSLSVGLVQDNDLVYARSLGVADRATGQPASPRTLYEIGSVGKVLTSTVLAILHERGDLRIDDPVEKWIPAIADVPRHPEGGPPITLQHLATHTSGLPGVPANVDHLPPFQWKGYSPEQLHQGFRTTELRHPAGRDLAYSTLGMGLLGHVMAVATRTPYEALIETELLRPLGMNDTVIELRPELRGRYSVGYDADDSPGEVPYYEYGILAGGGAHRSTVVDLSRFLRAQWGPADHANPLNESVRSELHRIRWRSRDGEILMALGWFAVPHEGVGTLLVHRGRTPGHGAVVGFIPEKRAGVILLGNRGGRDVNVRMEEFAERLLLRLLAEGG